MRRDSSPVSASFANGKSVTIKDEYLNALAGATAGMCASFMVCPLDVVKTRLQGQVHGLGHSLKYTGTFSAIVQIFRDEGLRGTYRGLSPTLLGMVPAWATYFTSYKFIKQRVDPLPWAGKSNNSQSLVHMISACGAGVLTATVTNPIWVVKTRIQMISSKDCQYSGTADAFGKIMREEGIVGFYRGLGPSLVGVSHITIQFPLYERLKKDLGSGGGQGASSENQAGIFSLIAAAAISKILASLFTYPHEVVRTRMYMDTGKELSMLSSYMNLFREGGVSAMYRGFLTNAVRVVPASAITFVSYEIVYEWLSSVYGEQDFRNTSLDVDFCEQAAGLEGTLRNMTCFACGTRIDVDIRLYCTSILGASILSSALGWIFHSHRAGTD